jgi:hypothetical protein
MDRGRRQLTGHGMRRMFTAAFLIALLSATTASAQDPQWTERFWIGVGGGAQFGGTGFDDTFEAPLYAETERVTVDYPVTTGPVIDVRGGYRVWKHFTIGLGVTRYSQRTDAHVDARLPHPFFDNQLREIEGTTSTLRGETTAHVLFGWMLPLSDRFRVMLTAGPSFFNVEHTLVTGVEFSETYPYDTAAFTVASTRRPARSATGFNAGADVTWMFSTRVGAGALVQVSTARARVSPAEGRSIVVDAGGVQASGGLRLFF